MINNDQTMRSEGHQVNHELEEERKDEAGRKGPETGVANFYQSDSQ